MNAYELVTGLALAWSLISCGGEAEYRPPELPPPPPPVPAVEPEPLPEPYSQAPPVAAPPSDAPPPPSSMPPSAPPSSAPSATSAAQLPMPGMQATRPTPSPPAESPPLVYAYPAGQWVYTVDHQWIWVPAGASTVDMEGMPYTYLYTPSFGWTWYVSPWGWGPYHYGLWVRHPWHPGGWHGYWVAHPHVIVRLGHGHYHRR